MKTYKITTTCIMEVKAEDEDEAFNKANAVYDWGDVVDQDIVEDLQAEIEESEDEGIYIYYKTYCCN